MATLCVLHHPQTTHHPYLYGCIAPKCTRRPASDRSRGNNNVDVELVKCTNDYDHPNAICKSFYLKFTV
ncbi:hypothetical protein NP233_g4787 [Leucocoprinus birnbaumii]|uniref:Uncharacterized protein n=1 Tax=Leucocoprinus birnbaumii TaxID=56174 RepID=A0AAD5VXQ6_9AGAR|nr:hypothetical protein NP233_g4787 [Leucocoprinus birnbaumii]